MTLRSLVITLIAAVATVVALVALAGCTEQPTPEEVLTRARAAMEEAGSYRFEATVFLPHATDTAAGEWVEPDRYHATRLGAEVIVIGAEQYARPLKEDWDVWRRTFISEDQPQPYDSLVIPPLTDLRFAETPRPDVYRIEGLALRVFGPGSSEGESYATAYALEIGTESFLVERIVSWLDRLDPRTDAPRCVTDTEVFDGCPRSVTTLYDHGAPIAIEPPRPAILATLVRDITPGEHGSSIGQLYAVNDTLVFIVNDEGGGAKLWTSDGTTEGTIVLEEVMSGPRGAALHALSVLGELLLFTAGGDAIGTELWRTDGTAEGTRRVKVIHPGGPGPRPWPAGLGELNGALYFEADDGEHGWELWRTDGTMDGTVLVKDIRPGPDGSSPGNLRSHSTPWFEPVVDGELYFTAEEPATGRELWKTDGTPSGTVLVKDIWPGWRSSIPADLGIMEGILYFRAEDEEHGRELWRSDGTEGGTWLVKDFVPGPEYGFPNDIIGVDGTLFFSANDGVHGRELWRSDGTEQGTVLVKDIRPGPDGSVTTDLQVVNGVIVFEANEGIHGQELWRSDGTEAGTWLVKDIRPGPEPSLPNDFRQVDGELAFIAMGDEAGHHQRWRTDGTPEGTVIVEEGIGDGFSSLQGRAVSAGGIDFFMASEWALGLELWKVTK